MSEPMKVPALTVRLTRGADKTIRIFLVDHPADGERLTRISTGGRSIRDVDWAKAIVRETLGPSAALIHFEEPE